MKELSIWVVYFNWSSRSEGEVKSIKLLQTVIQTEDMVTDTFAPLLICIWGLLTHQYISHMAPIRPK